MSDQLPAHASILAGPNVWMESEAVTQLARAATHPSCRKAVGMPDLHPGRGIPIGAVFLFEGQVLPELVGSDAGCGVLVLVGRKSGARGDALERRVLAALEEPLLPDVSRIELLQRVWRSGPRGLVDVPGIPDALRELAASAAEEPGESGDLLLLESHALQLGSVGGGNHFAEISRVDKIADKARARASGIANDAQVIVVHSGSRALGTALAARYAGRTLGPDTQDLYLADLRGAIRYARTNRLLIAWRLLRAAELGSMAKIALHFDIVHNAVEACGVNAFLHRKGAAPAARDQLTVVLGSRGAPSWLMSGLGNEACLCSVAHGAGRRMARGEAYDKLRAKYTRASLRRTELGTRVICDDTSLMYEEHPDAYKPIEPVIESLESRGAAMRIAALVPLLTVKQ